MAVRLENLPQVICLEDYGGDYKAYIDAIYRVFSIDFIRRKAHFGSNEIRLKFNPLFQERAYTFYHMTHEGENENERTPDLRRCERMPLARPTITKTEEYGLRFWEQERNGKHRICIWLDVDDGENYFVILDVRKTYVLLWTAFYATYTNTAAKKAKEYQEWLERVDHPLTPDELVADIMARLP